MNYKRTILHVDDDPSFTRLVAAHLRTRGYEVTSLNDASETLRMVGELHPRVVLLDIDMPQANGLDLLRQIKTTYGGTQVIMVTGVVSMQSLLQSYRWGAELCVFKPLASVDPLLEAMEIVFQKIDRWWAAAERLSKDKHGGESQAGTDRCPLGFERVAVPAEEARRP